MTDIEDIPNTDHRSLFASLDHECISSEASDLASSLAYGLSMNDARDRKRRKKDQEAFDFAVGAFLADLLAATADERHEGWVHRSMRPEGFNGGRVGYKTFKRLVGLMAALGAIEVHEDNPISGSSKRKASQFKATAWLLSQAKQKGIVADELDRHFKALPPLRVLELKSASTWRQGSKCAGQSMTFLPSAITDALAADIKRLNAFLYGVHLRGGKHAGYVRVFNNADPKQPYGWNEGGRLYSKCRGSYQSLSKQKRLEMALDGEPVVEIDIRASYLTLAHGLCGAPFDVATDPYDLTGFLASDHSAKVRRDAAKAWCTSCLGLGKLITRWSPEAVSDFNTAHALDLREAFPVRTMQSAMVSKHPLLRQWETLGHSWGALMFLESQAMLGAMLELMDDHGVPSLSVHDSIIVRARDEEIARGVLSKHYEGVCGLKPFLAVSRAS